MECPNCEVTTIANHSALEWAQCKADMYGTASLTDREQALYYRELAPAGRDEQ